MISLCLIMHLKCSIGPECHAVESEAARQIDLIEDGKEVRQETRRWDDTKGCSYAMRSKEDAQDYKYFPEPDLPPLSLSDEYINSIKESLPELPDVKKARYMNEFGLSDYDTGLICESLPLVSLFERTVEITNSPKDSANWILGEVLKMLNDTQTQPENIAFDCDSLGKIINLLNGGKISRDSAKKVFKAVFEENVEPVSYVEKNNLGLMNDTSAIKTAIEDVLKANEKAVNEYKSGKDASFNFLIGQSMKALRGKAPASEVTKILKELLS